MNSIFVLLQTFFKYSLLILSLWLKLCLRYLFKNLLFEINYWRKFVWSMKEKYLKRCIYLKLSRQNHVRTHQPTKNHLNHKTKTFLLNVEHLNRPLSSFDHVSLRHSITTNSLFVLLIYVDFSTSLLYQSQNTNVLFLLPNLYEIFLEVDFVQPVEQRRLELLN